MIKHAIENDLDLSNCLILHDLFGYLSCQLNEYGPQSIITFASQKHALEQNMNANECIEIKKIGLLEEWNSTKCVFIKVPKSLELFRLYLTRVSSLLDENGTVFCGFMTKYFTKAWLELAAEYFEEVDQTRAEKKARLLVLKGPKPKSDELISSFQDQQGKEWRQYLGVFSSGRIDPASLFMMEHLSFPSGNIQAVDVGSGNGVLGKFIITENPQTNLHLVDDNFLAVESSKLNIGADSVHHHLSRNLDFLEDESCDLVVSNPPFHFEYEVNMDVAFQIFDDAFKVLKNKGQLWVVANNNLPYKPQLMKAFGNAIVVAQNRKFIIYKAVKTK